MATCTSQCKVCNVRELLNIRHVHTNLFFPGLRTSTYSTYHFLFYQYYPNLPLVHTMFSLYSCYALGSTEISATKGITCVTGSNFNKYPAACKSAELIDWTHKQLKRITFVKQQVYSVCEPRKISYINKLTKDNISISIKATQYEPN